MKKLTLGNTLRNLLYATVALSAGNAFATIRESGIGSIFSSTKTYPLDTKIGFELRNKGKKIWMAGRNGVEIFMDKTGNTIMPLEPKAAKDFEIDWAQPTQLAVWSKEPKNKNITLADMEFFRKKLQEQAAVKERPDGLFNFTRNKTIYINWDDSEKPRPQTGLAKGILGKTDSGLSLKNNLTDKDITLSHTEELVNPLYEGMNK